MKNDDSVSVRSEVYLIWYCCLFIYTGLANLIKYSVSL